MSSARASLEAFIEKLEQSLGLATKLCRGVKVDDGSTATAASGTGGGAQNASAIELLDSQIHGLEATLRMKVADGGDIPVTNVTGSGGKKTRKKTLQHAAAAAPSASRPASARSSVGDQPEGTKVDLRVGQITNVWAHETGDKLYCEEIDVGEGTPRLIASGLVPHYSLEAMKDRRVVVMCNLKARNLKGFKSQGMVMCAAAAVLGGEKERVEFIVPPEGVPIGEKLSFEGVPGGPFEPATAAQMEKKKILEKVLPELRTDGDRVVRWQQYRLMSSRGPCVAPTIRDGAVR